MAYIKIKCIIFNPEDSDKSYDDEGEEVEDGSGVVYSDDNSDNIDDSEEVKESPKKKAKVNGEW